MLLPAASILALLSAGDPHHARKSPLSLTERVDRAVLVCIGTVEEVVEVPTPAGSEVAGLYSPDVLPFARVTVERVLKGDPEVQSVWHEVWPTWVCDDTRVTIGERALFFLGERCSTDGLPDEARASVRVALGGARHLRNVGSGDGIMTVGMVDGIEHVRTAGIPDTLRTEHDRYSARLDVVLEYVRDVVRFDLETVRLHLTSGGLDLRVLPDGSARLAHGGTYRETLTHPRPAPGSWARLLESLRWLVAQRERVVGDTSGGHLARQLTIRFPEGSLVLAEPREWNPEELAVGERFALLDALQAWALITATIECPGAEVHVEKDRAWLAELRR